MPEQKPTKIYAIVISALTLANVTQATIIGIGLPEAKAGRVIQHPVEHAAVYDTSVIAPLTISAVASLGCTKIDEDNELTGDDVCTMADLRGIFLMPNHGGDPDKVHVRVTGRKAMALSPAPAPE